jgi:hypothetical protein
MLVEWWGCYGGGVMVVAWVVFPTAPGLPLAAQKLLCHRGAFLCVLGDQLQPEEEVVVGEDV